MRRTLLLGVATAVIAGTTLGGTAARTAQSLPRLGAKLPELPDGPEKPVASQACLVCHSVDIVAQQRMTRQQWSASVTKMINWGAPVPAEKKDALVEYLATHFGPDNKRFKPVNARPVGR
jgi:hypothetical protein